MKDYEDFLVSKLAKTNIAGFEVDPKDLNPKLFLFQNAVVRWALRSGKAAIFESVGLGKTFQQLEWARLVVEYTKAPVIILAPLAVAQQTVREGAKFGLEVIYAPDSSFITKPAIYISNYERLEKFDCSVFGGVVLDESSILKSFMGKTKQLILSSFYATPFKLACTATPAPNDYVEFGNHAEFLGVKTASEMLSTWFINDLKTGEWRLKGHAAKDFWRWLTSWAVCISKPRDLGDNYDMQGYDLPPLTIHHEWVGTADASIKRAWKEGQLIPASNASATEIHKAKRESLSLRVRRVIEIIQAIPENEAILVWCETNYEADALVQVLLNAIEVRGSETPEKKEEKLLSFTDGKARILITKPSIAGMGLNWQHCQRAIFVSPSFSFESEYQAIGRNHRFGQEKEVHVYMIVSEVESNISDIVKRKRAAFDKMQKAMNAAMKEYGLFREDTKGAIEMPSGYTEQGKSWTMHLGDCVMETKHIAPNSVDMSIFSPPFADWFTFSDSALDMSNVADNEEFYAHFAYLVPELYRVMKAGRAVFIHIKDMPVHQSKEGYMGLHDMSGEIIRMFEAYNRPVINPPDLSGMDGTQAYVAMLDWQRQTTAQKLHKGFRYSGRWTVWKDPEIEMMRTKAHSLLYKNYLSNTQVVRNGLADYILMFRKWDSDMEEIEPVIKVPDFGDYIGTNPPSKQEVYGDIKRTPQYNWGRGSWARYASPVWWDIDQGDTLNYEAAKNAADEKHIVPLQRMVIERLIEMYSNKGEVVFDPFAGIGSSLVGAIKLGRKGLGVELKQEYFDHAVKNCQEAERAASQRSLFDLLDEQAATGD